MRSVNNGNVGKRDIERKKWHYLRSPAAADGNQMEENRWVSGWGGAHVFL